MLPTAIVRTGRADALYDDFRSQIAQMLYHQDLWANINVGYLVISILASVAIGITTARVTGKTPGLKRLNIARAFIIVVASV